MTGIRFWLAAPFTLTPVLALTLGPLLSLSACSSASPGVVPEPSSTVMDATASDDAALPGQDDSSVEPAEDAADGGSGEGAAEDDDVADIPASCEAGAQYPQSTFVNQAVPPGEPLAAGQGDPVPGDAGVSAPAGWDFHQGGLCRDGSPAGFFVHFSATASDKLFVYLEGGGACDSATFCSHNPGNIQTVFSGGAASQGQTIQGSLLFSSTGQVPYTATPAQGLTPAYSPGIFDFANTANPFKDWNAVYVPYCTGDVHFGTNDDADIPAQGLLPELPHQHFVGHLNLQKYLARIVPTFPGLSQVLLTGASAGAFGAGLNYAMVQDSFGKIPVSVLMDSALPFRVQFLPACLQKKWRALWGFDAALPSDCAECFHDDGSGLTDIVYYLLHKYRQARVAAVSTMQDEIIRLFYAQGENDCASDDATALTLTQGVGGGYTGAEYTMGIEDLLQTFECTGRVAAYQIGGTSPSFPYPTYHQHIFRQEFYEAVTDDGGVTMAQWAADFAAGKLETVGP
jgi:hypothetical protein